MDTNVKEEELLWDTTKHVKKCIEQARLLWHENVISNEQIMECAKMIQLEENELARQEENERLYRNYLT